MSRLRPLIFCFSLIAAGCGSDDPGPDRSTEAERRAAERDANTDNRTADGRTAERSVEDVASSMAGALGEAFGGEGRRVETVDFRTLRALLPEELDELARVDASGERTSVAGFSFSQAEGEYRSDDGDRQVSLQIVDAGGTGPLAMLASWRLVEFDRETSDGYERTTDYEGYPAMEKVRTGDRPRVELQFVVAERFFVSANGQNVGMDALKAAVEAIDLGELEDLRDEGVER